MSNINSKFLHFPNLNFDIANLVISIMRFIFLHISVFFISVFEMSNSANFFYLISRHLLYFIKMSVEHFSESS